MNVPVSWNWIVETTVTTMEPDWYPWPDESLAVSVTRPAPTPLITTDAPAVPAGKVTVLLCGRAIAVSLEVSFTMRGPVLGGRVSDNATEMLPPLPTAILSVAHWITGGGVGTTETRVESLNPSTESTA